jgi:pimeloyl-ACP methyl ester carboxylesterase
VRTTIAACAVALVVGGCGGGRTAGLQLSPCTIGGTANIAAECGNLAVAENPGDPNGNKINIHVAVVRATGPDPKPDPLFDFAGWGGAGVQDDGWLAPKLAEVNRDRDIVFIDQRGTGLSNELICPAPPQQPTPAEANRIAKACAAQIGPNLRYYTSAVAVDDYDQVRAALGYDEINVYGASYGVTLGQIYLLRHGSHVRTVVLDSGSLLDVRIFERIAPNAQRALDLLFARCAADGACSAAFGDVRAQYAKLAARLARTPVALPDTTSKLDEAGLARVIEEMLAFNKPEIPRVIQLAATGHIARAASIVGPPSAETGQLAYMLIVQCSEPWASWRSPYVEQLARGTFMEPVETPAPPVMAAACKAFPPGYAPTDIGRRVHSDVPVLFLQGNEDPADPPASVADARRELPNSRTIVFKASGHGQIGYPCAQHLVTEFIASASAAGLDATCAKSAAELHFDIRF